MMTVENLTVPIWNYSFHWSTSTTYSHEWHFEIMILLYMHSMNSKSCWKTCWQNKQCTWR